MAFRVAPIRGRVFAGRPRAGDVVQGELSNCHLAAAAAAVAHFRPEALILKARGRFYEATVFSAGPRPPYPRRSRTLLSPVGANSSSGRTV